MSRQDNRSNVSKRNINYEKMRLFFRELMAKAYSSSSLQDKDARSVAMLSDALLQFIIDSEKSDDAGLRLLSVMDDIRYINRLESDKLRALEDLDRIDSIPNSQKLITSDGTYLYTGSILGSGGEGSVYRIPSMPGKAAKIFHSNVDLVEKEKHLKAFIHNQVPSKIDQALIASIPETSLYYESGQFAGYMMPLISGQFKVYDVMRETTTRSQYFPELDYRGMIVIAYNLAEIVHTLHEHGVVVGDLNMANIQVNTDGTVCLLDTDSFDITDCVTGEHFPCRVGTPEMLAPELQTGESLSGRFNKETDYFSLAILIFRLLMNNADPFGAALLDYIGSVSYIPENHAIIDGECVYVKQIPGRKIPEWAPDLSALPEKIQKLFIRVFDYTKDTYNETIKQRPTAKEWMDALMEYYQMPMKQCRRMPFHWYRSELEGCPFCKTVVSPSPKEKTGNSIELPEAPTTIRIGI